MSDRQIKAVFFDVDGTLLSHRLNDVPDSTRRALQQLRAKGIRTIVATGRHMIEYSRLPVSSIPFDGYLTLNGNLLLDENQKVYAGTAIDPEEMKVLAMMFQSKRIPFVLIGEDDRYINYVNDTVLQTQAQTKGTIPEVGSYDGAASTSSSLLSPSTRRSCSIDSWTSAPSPAGTIRGSTSSRRAEGNRRASSDTWKCTA